MKSRSVLYAALLCSALSSIPSQRALGQRLVPGPFATAQTQEKRVYQANLGLEDRVQASEKSRGWSFPRRVGTGALAGTVSGAFLGSLISDWSLPGGAALGLVTGTITGLAVAVVAENGPMTKRRGFLIGALPAYCFWLAIGAPIDFVLDPLFLFGIPGWHAGKGSNPPVGENDRG